MEIINQVVDFLMILIWLTPLIVAAGLDAGKITPESSVVFGASVDVQGFTIHTAEDKAFGQENIGDILKHSDNVGMVWVGEQIGSQIIYDYIKKFGFTSFILFK